MTDLTEKWKNGELPDGFYYFKLPDGSTDIASEYKMIRYRLTKDADKVEILAPVPTYQEYLESEAHCAVYSEVNKQLLQLLKECKDIVSIEKDFASCHFEKDKLCKLLTKINAIIGESEE